MTDTAGYGKIGEPILGGRHADLFDHDRGGGDRHRFLSLYRRYKKLMLYIAHDILHDPHDAEDAVHEAFLRLAEMIEKIHEIDCPETRSLIVMITKSKAIDLYRKKKRRAGTVPLEDWAAAAPPQAEGVERGDGVARAIAALPRRERDVLLLKYDQGYGNSEIGKLLGLRPDHISQIAHRAKEHLRKIWRKWGWRCDRSGAGPPFVRPRWGARDLVLAQLPRRASCPTSPPPPGSSGA